MITLSQARALYTQMLIDVYQETVQPSFFLTSFFREKYSPTKYISAEITRTTEKMATDVAPGTEGNRNQWTKSTQKIWDLPTYREFFDATEFDVYDRVVGSQRGDNAELFASLVTETSDKLREIENKIRRAREFQAAQVFHTGIVQFKGWQIDYKRRAASIRDLGVAAGATYGGYWDANGVDPIIEIKDACKWLRQNGKVMTNRFNLILGEGAAHALLNNTKVLARQNFFNMKLDNITTPRADSEGVFFLGTIAAETYTVDLWSYPEYYDDPADATGNTMLPYIETDKAILLPGGPLRFVFAHGLVPQLVTDSQGRPPKQAPWVYGEFIDERRASHIFDVQTRCLAVPIAVDSVVTMKTIA